MTVKHLIHALACPCLAFVAITVVSFETAVAQGQECSTLFKNTVERPPELRASQIIIPPEFLRPPDDSLEGRVTDRVPISVASLVAAYGRGLFPYAVTRDGNGIWFSPPNRGVWDFENVRIGSSDRKNLRRFEEAIARGEIRVTFDTAFDRVIRACAEAKREMRDPDTHKLIGLGTWITEPIIRAYSAMFKAGYAHSTEVWRGDELVGGVYGVLVNGVFSGESMFKTIDNAGKLAMIKTIEHLKSRGFTWMDTQIAPPDSTSPTVKMGAREIPRAEFLQRLEESRKRDLKW